MASFTQEVTPCGRMYNTPYGVMNWNCILTFFIIGSTGTGKTFICKELLENASKFIDPPPVECIYNYGVYQDLYDRIKCGFPIKFVEGLSKMEDLPKDGQHRLLIIDDLMQEASESAEVANMFTKFSHHLNYSVVILTQNLFNKGKYFRTISLQAQYLFLLKSVRDVSIISTLGRQMGNSKFLAACYVEATSVPYGFLFLDLKASSDDKYRVRANIFNEPSIVFLK